MNILQTILQIDTNNPVQIGRKKSVLYKFSKFQKFQLYAQKISKFANLQLFETQNFHFSKLFP